MALNNIRDNLQPESARYIRELERILRDQEERIAKLESQVKTLQNRGG